MRLLFKRPRRHAEVEPDEILIDASNVSEFDRDQFEGRIERPINRRSFGFTGLILALVFLALLVRASDLQVVQGATFAKKAQDNQLSQKVIIADRGIITDRTGLPLAYNVRTSSSSGEFADRVYAPLQGLAHVVGYAKPPAKDSYGVYYRDAYEGVNGAERAFNTELHGQNGEQLTETDAHGKTVAESVTEPAQTGREIRLSIDANLTQGLYQALAARAQESGYQGGAAVIMDVRTGELLAMTSYPEFPQQKMEEGDSAAIAAANSDLRQPFLNRATSGLYAPGSIVKPVVATGALTEGVIDENKKILSTGEISIPNPYDKAHPSVFHDWRANGWVAVRDALAWSSDVYFYEVGGGYNVPGQPVQSGLGIDLLDKYFRLFGFGQDPGLDGFPDQSGNIPTIGWKAQAFPSDPTWHLGDTYHTAIGQYGMLVTPLQAVREAAAIANGGTLLTPTLIASSSAKGKALGIPPHVLEVVREGMRQGVTSGIATAVKFDFVHVAAKTGTAQVGLHNEYINSWMIGFFPYENPKYAYAMVLERGPGHSLMGSPAAMSEFFTWMRQNAPQYLSN